MKKTFFPKNNLVAGILVLSVLVFSASCKKLIEIPSAPPNQISQQFLFADSSSVMSAIAGVYNCNYNASTGFAYRNAELTLYTSSSADDLALTTSTTNTEAPQFYTNTLLSNNGSLNTLWSNIYKNIYQVNACLTGVPASPLSAAKKDQLLGEMEVVRALHYFNLVNLFGGVPLATTTDYNITGKLARSSADDVYTQILADLTDAQSKLKAAYPSAGRARPNLYTASALLAKVYLYKGQWQNAYNAANQVISSGIYSLVPDLNGVFLDGSKEAIWQLPANGVNYSTGDANRFVIPNGTIPTYPVNIALLKAFETGDQRRQKWIGNSTVGTTVYNFPYKYKNVYAASSTTEDMMIFRLAELYLIRAEASANLGNTSSAITDLNMIRTRAGLPATTASSQTDVLTAIMHERQTELCFEMGNRWYDLKRTGTVVPVLSAEKTGWASSPLVYPIPFTDIQNDPNLVQTPGYN